MHFCEKMDMDIRILFYDQDPSAVKGYYGWTLDTWGWWLQLTSSGWQMVFTGWTENVLPKCMPASCLLQKQVSALDRWCRPFIRWQILSGRYLHMDVLLSWGFCVLNAKKSLCKHKNITAGLQIGTLNLVEPAILGNSLACIFVLWKYLSLLLSWCDNYKT